MSKKRQKKKMEKREQPKSCSFLLSADFHDMVCTGYTRLSQNPEIVGAVNRVAELIAGMTIHLIANGKNGDERIKNELSRKLDIDPNRYMTKRTFIAAIVRNLLLEGDGNSVALPETQGGYLQNIWPIDPGAVSFVPDGWGYTVRINGQTFDPDNVLHFVINPDPHYPWRGTGYRVALKDVLKNLKQAGETKKGFMESKWKPSLIISADGMTDGMGDPIGRREILDSYIATTQAGEPWLVPAETFNIQEVRPLSLNDLAINDAVEIDKKTAAAVVGVPPFLVGVGDFKPDEWNNFVNTKLRAICGALEQEFTRKLLRSPSWYFRFNSRSLYTYDISTLSTVGANMYTRGIMTGNEVRDWLAMTPLAGLDELVILENYIPAGMIGDQKKLSGGGENNGTTNA